MGNNLFTNLLNKHFNTNLTTPQPPAATSAPARPPLPRTIYVLTRNGTPIGTYTDKATADEDKFVCLQADERTGEFDQNYEITSTRLCYAKKQ